MLYYQELLDFFHEKFLKIASIISALLSGFVLLSILSYNTADPSLNNATADEATNLMSYAGAYTADLLYQFFGISGGPILALIGLMWAYRFYNGRFVSKLWVRVAALVFAISCLAAVFSAVAEMGGVVGGFINNSLYRELTAPIFNTLFLGLFLVSAHFSSGLRLRETREFFQKAIRPIERIFAKPDPSVKKKPKIKHKLGRAKWQKRSEPSFGDEDEIGEEERHIRIDETPRRPQSPRPVAKQQNLLLGKMDDDFELPPVELLREAPNRYVSARMSESSLEQNARILEKVLEDFGVKGEIQRISPGPVVTLYEFEPAAGTKSSKVIGLAEDIARSMSAVSARIAVIPGQNALGIELPNSKRETVYFRELMESDEFKKTEAKLPLALGKDIGGVPVIADLTKMPHLLVAGTTGSGKSVAINTMITSLIYTLPPSKCKFIMIDPKMLELSVYQDIPHLLAPVVTEPHKAVIALKWVVKEMENRYRLMSTLGVRNVDGYNKRIEDAIASGEVLEKSVQTGFDPSTGRPVMEKIPIDMEKFPYIVVVVDEMADLMLVAGKDIEAYIQRLAQMARAAGIHLIMATQRPSVDVITGVIKANFPTRMSFQVTSKIDSRTILGEQGAEQLLGQGDMLYMAGGGRINRVHGPFIDDREVEKIVRFLKAQGKPEYVQQVTVDEDSDESAGGVGIYASGSSSNFDDAGGGEDASLYDQAVGVVLRDKKASTSYIQRRLRIGYNRAASLIEEMEQNGVISEPNHAGKREILVPMDNA
jgi:S-DNA-T family DNA segregation ATPase FtsK/SpoIIIE